LIEGGNLCEKHGFGGESGRRRVQLASEAIRRRAATIADLREEGA
jgi:hypothetical protein